MGDGTLRSYLGEEVKVHPGAVDLAMKRLKSEGNAAIFHTILSAEKLVDLGLK